MPAKKNFVLRRRKALLLTLSVLLGLSLLTACTAPASTSGASPATGAQAAPLSADSELAVGILKLENTAQAVDAKEAAELLPLWQLLSELKSSSSERAAGGQRGRRGHPGHHHRRAAQRHRRDGSLTNRPRNRAPGSCPYNQRKRLQHIFEPDRRRESRWRNGHDRRRATSRRRW